MKDPLVSIIIPTFNRAHLINETLDSVLAQTYNNWECVVIDDGSTDNTHLVVGKYMMNDSRIKYYKRPIDRMPGGNEARNYGFEICKGTYVNWFDDDDVMLPNFLEEMVDEFEDGIDLVINSVSYWNPKASDTRLNILKIRTTLYQDYLCWNFGIITNSIFFRKRFLLRKKLFSNRIHRGQETEFFLRIFYNLPENSYKVLNKKLFLYRQHVETKTNRNKMYLPKFKNSEYIIYFDNFLKLENSANKIARQFCYQRLLSLFYASIYNNDLELARKIFSNFFPLVRRLNFRRGIELSIMGYIFIFFNLCSYKTIQRWKTFEL